MKYYKNWHFSSQMPAVSSLRNVNMCLFIYHSKLNMLDCYTHEPHKKKYECMVFIGQRRYINVIKYTVIQTLRTSIL